MSASIEALERELTEARRQLAELRLKGGASTPTEASAPLSERVGVSRVLQASMEGFWLTDERGRFLDVNPAYCALIGYSRDELLMMAIDDVEASESPAETAAHIRAVLRKGSDRFLTRHRRKDGTVFDIEVSAHHLPEEGCFFAFLRDATARIRAEEARRISWDGLQQEARQRIAENAILRTALEQLPVAVLMTDRTGRIEYVNPAFSKITGYTRDEVLGRTPRILKSGQQDRAFYARMWDGIIAGVPWRGEVVNRRKDGTLYTQELVIAPVHDADGKVTHFVGIGEDVTEARRLRSSLEMTQLAVDRATDMVIWSNAEGRVVYANDSAVEGLGYSRDELASRAYWDISESMEAGDWAAAWEAIRSAGSHRAEDQIRRKDGTTFAAEVVITHLGRGGSELHCAIMRDLTLAKALESQLFQAQKMEAVGQLAGGVAHDFNNLITIILSFTSFVKEELPEDHSARADLAEVIGAATRGADLVQQLLAFSRQQVTKPRVLSANDLVLGMGKLLQRTLGEHLEFAVLLDPDLWLTRIDPGRFEQVLVNLAVNARHAMLGGGKLTIETRNVVLDEAYAASHADAAVGEYVLLAVSDSGCGIAPEALSRVFEPFFTTKALGQGTGLGLSTCFGIVKQAGGHIRVYSELGKGTTFKIYLPRADATEVDAVEAVQSPSVLPTGCETILVAEDDAMVRASVVRSLTSLGYTVLDSATPREALRIAEEHTGPIDLLITDVVMPELNGGELAREVAFLHPEAAVLYVSGYTNNAVVHRGELSRDVSFLEKPFLPAVLAKRVRALLDASR